MGSGAHFNFLAGFRAVDAWQQNIIRNAQGLMQPGYNLTRQQLGGTPSGKTRQSQAGTSNSGGRGGMHGTDTLSVGAVNVHFAQGKIDPALSQTALAIRGQGFFLVAENLNPGAKLMLTRNGDFRYDSEGRLVTAQGLFVVGGNGVLTDPPQPVMNPGDGSVVLPELTLARVPSPDNLAMSGYGNTVYALTEGAGPMRAFANGRPEVGFVQANSLEWVNPLGVTAQLQFETNQAQQTYKLFKDMLESYNRMVDDSIGTVR